MFFLSWGIMLSFKINICVCVCVFLKAVNVNYVYFMLKLLCVFVNVENVCRRNGNDDEILKMLYKE